MKHSKIYIITGQGKDIDGSCRKEALRIITQCGAAEAITPDDADLILVLGGDGSIMHAAHTAHALDIPLIGVNLGRIGYLAELERGDLPKLADVIEGKYRVEERMVMTVKHRSATYTALNDAVIRAESTHPASVTLQCDGQTVATYRGDGLICSTPTGSTAYSVSAGGSVVDPRLHCFCLTPLCPQSLVARPLVFSAESTLVIRANIGYRCILTVDGDPGITMAPNEKITVKRSDRPLRMLRVSDDGFYSILSRKLYI